MARPRRAFALTLRSTLAPYSSERSARCQRVSPGLLVMPVMTSPRSLRLGDAAGRVGPRRADHRADRILNRRLDDHQRSVGETVEAVELRRRHRLERQMAFGKT